MMFMWRSPGVGMEALGWGWLCVWGCTWVGEWVLDKWHSLYANTHYSMGKVHLTQLSKKWTERVLGKPSSITVYYLGNPCIPEYRSSFPKVNYQHVISQAELHRVETKKLGVDVEELERQNLELMSQLFDCRIEDLKISR